MRKANAQPEAIAISEAVNAMKEKSKTIYILHSKLAVIITTTIYYLFIVTAKQMVFLSHFLPPRARSLSLIFLCVLPNHTH